MTAVHPSPSRTHRLRPQLRRSARTAVVTAAAVLASVSIAACGSKSSTTATTGAGYEIVSDSAVAAGLAATEALLTTITNAGTATTAQIDQIEEGWESYEGAIKQNEKAVYLGIEDALTAFKKAVAAADATAMTKALADFSGQSTTYLGKHPG